MTRKRLLPSLLISLLVTTLLLTMRAADPIALSTLRGAGFDTMQRIWPRHDAVPQPVRIVDIDEASLKELGQWPWPRTQLAKLVDELNELGASVVAFDIVFPEADRMSPDLILNNPAVRQAIGANAISPSLPLPNNDAILAKAITGRPVVNAFATSTGVLTETPLLKAGFAQTGLPALNAPLRLGRLTQNLKILDQAAAGLGSINIDLAGEQGIARQIPLLFSDGKNYFPSLVLEALRVAQGADTYVINASANTENALESIRIGAIEIPVTERGQLSVYYNHNSPDLYVSAARVINGTDREALRPLLAGHIVLIGTSAVGLLDTRTSSLGEEIPGVSVHAQALQQILSGTFLNRPEWAAASEIIFVALIGLLISIGMAFFRPLPLVASLFVIISALVVSAAYAFKNLGLLIDITFPVLAVATIFLTTIAFRLLVTDREGRQLRNVFSHYVAPSILNEIENNPKALKLGGEIRDVTVMFVDIQNFTPMSESLKPEILVSIVNKLLSACSAGILEYGGTIDKFIGDAVMAFWNAPIAQADHQYLASLAALEIQARIEAFNAEDANRSILEPHGFWPIAIRVGLASGQAIVGNMGSLERFDYSALGETVNVASRAEGVCKHVGHNIVIAGLLRTKTSSLAIIPAGSIMIRGKSKKTPIHLLLGNESYGDTPEHRNFLELYHAIMEKLKTGKHSQSLENLISTTRTQHPTHAAFLDKLQYRTEDYENTTLTP